MFADKADFCQLQAADLLAWSHNHYLTKGGRIASRYRKGLDYLAGMSSDWGIINLSDPDKIPTILGIPLRDPRFRYQCKILRQDGKRRPVTHYWPKDQPEPEFNRSSTVLPETPILTDEQIAEAKIRYEAMKRGIS
jgi:hypothetical protein